MADLSQTPANVKTGANAETVLGTAGEDSIQAGMPLYLSTTDGKYYRADANDSSRYRASALALTAADEDEAILVQTAGDANLGATTVAGEIYIVSSNIGAIAPCGDLASGMYPAIVGMAEDTSGSVKLNFGYGDTAKS